MQRPFRRLAIVNRGEAAMRAISAVRELNEERPDPIRIIALHTEPERHAPFVREADERHCLGPATVTDGDGRRRSGYLDYAALERALMETQADAAWVGWGLVAEHPEFAELCERLGIVFAGPDAGLMRAVGEKIEAKRLAEQAGVPVAPWSGGPVESVEEAVRHGEALGFPLMIKAAAGGGGRGMRRVERADELPTAFERAREEAAHSFGDPSVLMERRVGAARHVEVQLTADGHGAVWALGVRDCSYQRRHQKVVEESASPALSADLERELASAVRLAERAGYRGAGTVEFPYEPAEGLFSFMEVNTRLQVEHPVTEMVTGAELVKLQLHVAAGDRLEGDPPPPTGHAIEVRLNAEDPGLGFAPTPGRIALLRLPGGPGVRVNSGVADTMVVIDEGNTNQGFLLELLGRPELRAGDVDTGWLDRLQGRGEVQSTRHADVALVRAAIALCDDATAGDRGHFYAFARRGRPEAWADVRRSVHLRYRGASYRFAVSQVGPHRYLVELDGTRIEVELERVTEHECRISYGARSYRTLTALQDADLLVEVNGVPHRVSRDEVGLVRSLGAGVVVAIRVSAGDELRAGDVVAVTESMKMESSLTPPVNGRVRQVLVSANTQVAAGSPLLRASPRGRYGSSTRWTRTASRWSSSCTTRWSTGCPASRSRWCCSMPSPRPHRFRRPPSRGRPGPRLVALASPPWAPADAHARQGARTPARGSPRAGGRARRGPRRAGGAREVARAIRAPAPKTPLNVETGAHRRVAFARFERGDFNAVQETLGRQCQRRDARRRRGRAAKVAAVARGPHDGLELRAPVPVSVRRRSERGQLGNRLALMRASLPVGVDDPVTRVLLARQTMDELKRSSQARGAELLASVQNLAPPPLLGQASRLQFSTRLFNLLVTYVPGQNFPLYILGRELRALLPLAFLARRDALSVGIATYNGGLTFGLLGDRDAIGDLDTIATHLDVSGRAPRRHRRWLPPERERRRAAVRRWALLLLGGLVALALALAGQLLLPRFAERRVARDIGRSADVQRTTVRSVPALKLLWNRADRVEVVMTETRAGPARLAELLHDARGVNELDARAARARLGTVMLRDLRIEKRGEDVRARATLADADLAAALPPGLTARAGAAPNGELMLEAGPSVGGLRLPVQAQARLVARDGAVVIAPDGLLTGLASLTVFSDPNLQVTGLEARRRAGGYDITARGRLAGA